MIARINIIDEDLRYGGRFSEVLCVAYYEIDNRTAGLFDQIDLIIRNYKNIRSMKISKERKAFKLLESTGAGTIIFEKCKYLEDNENRIKSIKEKDFQNKFINMENGYIMLNNGLRPNKLSIPSMRSVGIGYNYKSLSYDGMIKWLTSYGYNTRYKDLYKMDIESIPKFDIDPHNISFDKWDEFKQIVLSNKFMKFKNGSEYSLYARLN